MTPLRFDMSDEERAAGIMARMGYTDADTGRYVTELRALTLFHVQRGMISQSGGTWSPGNRPSDPEERAKRQLAFEWEIQHGHSYRVRTIDSRVLDTRYNVRTMRMSRRINWRLIPSKVADLVGRTTCAVRVVWHRHILRLRNPYL